MALNYMANSLFLPDVCQPAHIPLIEWIYDKWRKAAYWVAHEIVPEIDIYRKPYTRKSYKPTLFFAKTLNCLLQLCKGTWENSPEAREYSGYGDHWHWWTECILELKLYEVQRGLGLIAHRVLYPTKADEIKEHREFLHSLRKLEMPERFSKFSRSSHLCRLFDEAMYLCRISQFKDEYWNPYIDTYQQFIEDFRKQKLIGTFVVRNDNILYKADKGGYKRRVLIEKLLFRDPLLSKEGTQPIELPIIFDNPKLGKKEDKLCITFKPWRDQLVYVSEAPRS